MTKMAHGLAFVAALVSSVSPALSESNFPIILGKTEGKVLVSQGAGFEPSTLGSSLRAGDKVMVSQDGTAILLYPNCNISLSGGQIFMVPAAATCGKGETVASVDGVFVTPVALSAPATNLDRIISRHSKAQIRASKTGQAEAASCLGDKVGKLKSLKNFWMRNPGIDPTTMIEELDVSASNCNAPGSNTVQQASKAPKTVNEVAVTEEAAPIGESMAAGGMKGSTMALVGVGALVVVGLGTLLVLSKDDKKSVSGAP